MLSMMNQPMEMGQAEMSAMSQSAPTMNYVSDPENSEERKDRGNPPAPRDQSNLPSVM